MFTAAELAFMTISFPPGLVQRCPVTRVRAWTSGHSYRTVAHSPAAMRLFAPRPGGARSVGSSPAERSWLPAQRAGLCGCLWLQDCEGVQVAGVGQDAQHQGVGEPANIAAAELHLAEHSDSRSQDVQQALPVVEPALVQVVAADTGGGQPRVVAAKQHIPAVAQRAG